MKSILIIGLGRFGRHMARKLVDENNAVLAIEKNEERAEQSIDVVQNIQIGDATNERFIKSLGIDNFDLCVVAIGDNFQTALEITVLLKDCGAKYVVARAGCDVHKKLLLRNGADYVVYAEYDMAERLAVKFGSENIFDYIELTSECAIYEIAVPNNWIGKSIVEISVRNKYSVSILATKFNGKINPIINAEHIFSHGETIMVMGSRESISRLTK